MSDVVVVGMGELGRVFADGFARAGHTVHPVIRSTSMASVSAHLPAPSLVLIAVGEADLAHVLETLPSAWRDRAALLQNELRPEVWRKYLVDPTLAVVWFEKKAGRDLKPILNTNLIGPHATLLRDALDALAIPCVVEHGHDALRRALVLKNAYILVTNIAGLTHATTTGGLLHEHGEVFEALARKVILVELALFDASINEAEIREITHALRAAFLADPNHALRGRTAEARAARFEAAFAGVADTISGYAPRPL